MLFLSAENAGTEFPPKVSRSSYTSPLEFDKLSFFVLLELLNLLISSNGSVKYFEDESIGAEVGSNTLKGSSVSPEAVLEELIVGCDDKSILGTVL